MLDTDVIIAALDRGDAHHRRTAAMIRQALDDGVDLVASTVNYAEALVRPAEEERTLLAATRAIVALRIRLVPPGEAAARDAARYRASNISLADGFALAAARAEGAAVASFDRRVQRAAAESSLELAPGLAE